MIDTTTKHAIYHKMHENDALYKKGKSGGKERHTQGRSYQQGHQ